MLSKAQIKYIRSLTQQKYRKEYNVFIVEGEKMVAEWLNSGAKVYMIVALQDWVSTNTRLLQQHHDLDLHIVKEHELEALSTQQSPQGVLLIAQMPAAPLSLPQQEWCIALDNIQDPGNMGTIIRIADWFGIKHVVCGHGCVDVYNPKVVQSAMGGHLRVQLHHTDLDIFIATTKMPVLAATLDGTDIYKAPQMDAAVLLIGNESKGISPQLAEKATHKLTIPRRGGAESLNAAVSTGIVCALLLRS